MKFIIVTSRNDNKVLLPLDTIKAIAEVRRDDANANTWIIYATTTTEFRELFVKELFDDVVNKIEEAS